MEQVIEKCWYQHFEQLPGNFFRIFFSVSRSFTNYYLHAKFQINWTIQTEITEGGGGAESAIPICKNPGLFRVKILTGCSLRLVNRTQTSKCVIFIFSTTITRHVLFSHNRGQ